jgi:hypothetical protein
MDLPASRRTGIPAALLGAVALLLVAGCGDERASISPGVPARSLAPPEPVDPAVLAALTGDPRCRCVFQAFAQGQAAESLGDELRFSLDPSIPMGVRIPAIAAVLHLRASTMCVIFERPRGVAAAADGPRKVRALRLYGSPALVTDADGHPMAVSSGITLGLDESGVSTIDIEPGGSILQIPGA